MAEKKKSVIEAVTLNTATFTDVTFEPSYINFFYGKNGAGKTSLGRQLGEGAGLTWSDGEVPGNYQIELYNQDFIDTYFKTLDKLQGVFTLSEGKETEDAEKKIRELETRRKDLLKREHEIEGEDGELAKAAKTLETAEGNFQGACLRSSKTMRDKYKHAFRGSSRNPQLSQKIFTSVPKDCDEDKLNQLYDTSFAEGAQTYPLLTELDYNDHIATIPTCSLLGEEIKSKGATEYAKFVNDIGALPWIEEGHQKYHQSANGKCPYCNQPIPTDFEEQFASCFDDEYQRKIHKIEDFRTRYLQHMGIIYEILKSTTEADTLPSVKEKINSLKPMVENFLRAMREMGVKIDDKLKTPSAIIKIEDLAPMLTKMNDIIHQCNDEIRENNKIVGKLEDNQDKCIQDVWSLLAFRMQGEIDTLRLAKKDSEDTNDRLNKEIAAIKDELNNISQSIEKLGTTSTTIQAAIDGMNQLLRDSGFEGFEIVKSDMAPNAYKVVRGDKKEIAVRLSDGERHFLSFLYFYNRVKGCDENGVLKDKIVVIDDPVSSLDGNALFIISSLVREMIEVCYNNTDYRGQTVKGDYIK